MRWSQMNSAQRAYLLAGAKFGKDVVKNNKFVRQGEPKNAKAMIIASAKALDRDYERQNGRAEMLKARAQFTDEEISKLATLCEPGNAWRGNNDTNRKRGGAMPMNFYRAVGIAY